MYVSDAVIMKHTFHKAAIAITILSLISISILGCSQQTPCCSDENDLRFGTRQTTWSPPVGWSPDVPITSNVLDQNFSTLPSIASEDSTVHIVFENWQKDPEFKPYNRDRDIYYTRSQDGGRNWSANSTSKFIQLSSPVEDKFWGFSMYPTIDVSDSVVHVAYVHNPAGWNGDTRIRYRRSIDSGETWKDEVEISSGENKSDRLRPSLHANGNFVFLFWHQEEFEHGEPQLHLYYRRSVDYGASWEEPRFFAKPTEQEGTGCRIGMLSNTIKTRGEEVFALYLCGWPEEAIYFQKSPDNGVTWTDGTGIPANRTLLIRFKTEERKYVSVASLVLTDNRLLAFYQVISLDKREEEFNVTFSYQVFYMVSEDEGATWSNPVPLVDHTDMPERTPGCRGPHGGPAWEDCGNRVWFLFAESSGDTVYAVWQDKRTETMPEKATPDNRYNFEVFFTESEDAGSTWGPHVRLTDSENGSAVPSIAISNGMLHVAWVDAHFIFKDTRKDCYDIYYKRYPNFNSSSQSVRTVGVSEVNETKAILQGNVTSLGDYLFAEARFEWRQEGASKWDNLSVGRVKEGDFEAELDSVHPATKYEFRAVATTETIAFGEILNFTTGSVSPPRDLRASLAGQEWKDVRISWNASMDDPSGVSSYSIYFSDHYDADGDGYSFLASIPSNGSSAYSFSHEDAGHGDPHDYFYCVQANSSVYLSSRSDVQVAKIAEEVSEGENLISVPLVLDESNPDIAFRTLEFESVRYYNRTHGWIGYWGFKPYSGNLVEVDPALGLWITVPKAGTLTVTGVVPRETLIELKKGWNLIGFPSFNESYTVADLTIETGAVRVEGFDSLSLPFRLRLLADSETLQTGQGYWLRVSSSATWVVRS